jgi:hypothetical protein
MSRHSFFVGFRHAGHVGFLLPLVSSTLPLLPLLLSFLPRTTYVCKTGA